MADGVTVIPLPGQPKYGDSSPESPVGRLDFFAGPENRLIETAVQSLLAGHAAPFNPLVLYGPSGAGKSHLAQGLAAAWRNYFPGSRVICKTAVDFARDLAEAIETQAEEDFRQTHRTADLAVFEDLGELATKPTAQQELVHTLDALLACNCQVVATARVSPVEVPKLLPALQSRLAAGLTVPIEPPGVDARLEFLRCWTAQRNLSLAEPILLLLAQGLTGTVPQLIGAMLQLEVPAADARVEVDRRRVKEFLAARNAASEPKVSDIAMATARHFKLRLADLRGQSRRRSVVAAREVAIYVTRQLTKLSLQRIGEYYGGRDHTTVMHACRKTAELLRTDPAIHHAVELLQVKLGKV